MTEGMTNAMLPERTHSWACSQRSLHRERETLGTMRRDAFCTWGLTFDLSGVPEARPLEGRVRRLSHLMLNSKVRVLHSPFWLAHCSCSTARST